MAGLRLLVAAALLSSLAWGQNADRMKGGPLTVIGPRNPELQDGAQALLAGRAEEGVELTLRGLAIAQGARETEAALSNLCAGYVMLERYETALEYCDRLLARNDRNWRGYNNRALIHIHNEHFEKAHRDLMRGEELNPGARTLKIARSLYLNAVDPVVPEIEIDDRRPGDDGDGERP